MVPLRAYFASRVPDVEEVFGEFESVAKRWDAPQAPKLWEGEDLGQCPRARLARFRAARLWQIARVLESAPPPPPLRHAFIEHVDRLCALAWTAHKAGGFANMTIAAYRPPTQRRAPDLATVLMRTLAGPAEKNTCPLERALRRVLGPRPRRKGAALELKRVEWGNKITREFAAIAALGASEESSTFELGSFKRRAMLACGDEEPPIWMADIGLVIATIAAAKQQPALWELIKRKGWDDGALNHTAAAWLRDEEPPQVPRSAPSPGAIAWSEKKQEWDELVAAACAKARRSANARERDPVRERRTHRKAASAEAMSSAATNAAMAAVAIGNAAPLGETLPARWAFRAGLTMQGMSALARWVDAAQERPQIRHKRILAMSADDRATLTEYAGVAHAVRDTEPVRMPGELAQRQINAAKQMSGGDEKTAKVAFRVLYCTTCKRIKNFVACSEKHKRVRRAGPRARGYADVGHDDEGALRCTRNEACARAPLLAFDLIDADENTYTINLQGMRVGISPCCGVLADFATLRATTACENGFVCAGCAPSKCKSNALLAKGAHEKRECAFCERHIRKTQHIAWKVVLDDRGAEMRVAFCKSHDRRWIERPPGTTLTLDFVRANMHLRSLDGVLNDE